MCDIMLYACEKYVRFFNPIISQALDLDIWYAEESVNLQHHISNFSLELIKCCSINRFIHLNT